MSHTDEIERNATKLIGHFEAIAARLHKGEAVDAKTASLVFDAIEAADEWMNDHMSEGMTKDELDQTTFELLMLLDNIDIH